MFATVSPREITLYRERPDASAQNLFTGPILELVPEPPEASGYGWPSALRRPWWPR